MRLLLTLLAALLLIGCTRSRDISPSEPPRLRVLTYNIHVGIGMDRRIDLERIAQIIRQCNPDIVALQELDNRTARTQHVDQPAELARLTGMEAHFGKTLNYMGGEYGIGILSRHPIAHVWLHRLPALGLRERRAALAARIVPGNGLPPFLFVCTHLDHTGDEQNSLPQVRAINERFVNGHELAILAGDINKQPTTPTVCELLPHWTNATDGQERLTIPSTQPTHQIDYIFYRPASRWRVVETCVLDEPLASDHRPLLVTLELIPGSR